MSLAESRATPSGRKSTSATAAWPRDTAQGCCSGCGSGTLLSHRGTVKLQLGQGRCQGVMSGLRPCQGAMPGPQQGVGRATPMPVPPKGRWQPLGTLTSPAACPGLAATDSVPPLTGRTGMQGTEPRALPDPMGGTLGHSPSLCVPRDPQCHLALPKHPPSPSAAQGPRRDTAPTQPGAREGRAAGAAAQLLGLPRDVTFLVTLPPPKGHSQLPDRIVITTVLGTVPLFRGHHHLPEYLATLRGMLAPSWASTTSLGPVLPCLGYCHLPGDISTFPGTLPFPRMRCHLPGDITNFRGTVLPFQAHCHLPGEHCHLPGHRFAFQGTVPPSRGGCHLPGDITACQAHSCLRRAIVPVLGDSATPPRALPPARCRRGYL